MSCIEARERAQRYMFDMFLGVYSGSPDHVLDPEYLESEFCWMFFHRRDINIPDVYSLSKVAFVFPKFGDEGRQIHDFRGEPEKLREKMEFFLTTTRMSQVRFGVRFECAGNRDQARIINFSSVAVGRDTEQNKRTNS